MTLKETNKIFNAQKTTGNLELCKEIKPHKAEGLAALPTKINNLSQEEKLFLLKLQEAKRQEALGSSGRLLEALDLAFNSVLNKASEILELSFASAITALKHPKASLKYVASLAVGGDVEQDKDVRLLRQEQIGYIEKIYQKYEHKSAQGSVLKEILSDDNYNFSLPNNLWFGAKLGANLALSCPIDFLTVPIYSPLSWMGEEIASRKYKNSSGEKVSYSQYLLEGRDSEQVKDILLAFSLAEFGIASAVTVLTAGRAGTTAVTNTGRAAAVLSRVSLLQPYTNWLMKNQFRVGRLLNSYTMSALNAGGNYLMQDENQRDVKQTATAFFAGSAHSAAFGVWLRTLGSSAKLFGASADKISKLTSRTDMFDAGSDGIELVDDSVKEAKKFFRRGQEINYKTFSEILLPKLVGLSMRATATGLDAFDLSPKLGRVENNNCKIKEINQERLDYLYAKKGILNDFDKTGFYDETKKTIYVLKDLDSIQKKAKIAHELRHHYAQLSSYLKDSDDIRKVRVSNLVEARAWYQEEMELRRNGRKRVFNYSNTTYKEVELSDNEKAQKLSKEEKLKIYNDVTKYVSSHYSKDFLLNGIDKKFAASLEPRQELEKSIQALQEEFSRHLVEGSGLKALDVYKELLKKGLAVESIITPALKAKIAQGKKKLTESPDFQKRPSDQFFLNLFEDFAADTKISEHARALVERFVLFAFILEHGGPFDVMVNISSMQVLFKYIANKEEFSSELRVFAGDIFSKYFCAVEDTSFMIIFLTHAGFVETFPKLSESTIVEEISQFRKYLTEYCASLKEAKDFDRDKEKFPDQALFQKIINFIPRLEFVIEALSEDSYKNLEEVDLKSLLLNNTFKTKPGGFIAGPAVKLLQNGKNNEGVTLDLSQLEKGLPLQLHTNSKLLLTAIERFISNASVALVENKNLLPDKKVIKVELKERVYSNELEIIISNPGKIPDGLLEIDPETLKPKMFSLNKSRKLRNHGIGGVMAARIIEDLGGGVEVRNIEDEMQGDENNSRVEFKIVFFKQKLFERQSQIIKLLKHGGPEVNDKDFSELRLLENLIEKEEDRKFLYSELILSSYEEGLCHQLSLGNGFSVDYIRLNIQDTLSIKDADLSQERVFVAAKNGILRALKEGRGEELGLIIQNFKKNKEIQEYLKTPEVLQAAKEGLVICGKTELSELNTGSLNTNNRRLRNQIEISKVIALSNDKSQKREARELLKQYVCGSLILNQGGPYFLTRHFGRITSYIENFIGDSKRSASQYSETLQRMKNATYLHSVLESKALQVENAFNLVDASSRELIEILITEQLVHLQQLLQVYKDGKAVVDEMLGKSFVDVFIGFKESLKFADKISLAMSILSGQDKSTTETSLVRSLAEINEKNIYFEYNGNYVLTAKVNLVDKANLKPLRIALRIDKSLGENPETIKIKSNPKTITEIVEMVMLMATPSLCQSYGQLSEEQRTFFVDVYTLDQGRNINIRISNKGELPSFLLLPIGPNNFSKILELDPDRKNQNKNIFGPALTLLVKSIGGTIVIDNWTKTPLTERVIREREELSRSMPRVEVEITLPVEVQVEQVKLPSISNPAIEGRRKIVSENEKRNGKGFRSGKLFSPDTEFADSLFYRLQKAGLAQQAASLLATSLVRIKNESIMLRTDIFTDSLIEKIVNSEVLTSAEIDQLVNKIKEEENLYKKCKIKNKDIQFLLYTRLVPSAWIESFQEIGFTPSEMAALFEKNADSIERLNEIRILLKQLVAKKDSQHKNGLTDKQFEAAKQLKLTDSEAKKIIIKFASPLMQLEDFADLFNKLTEAGFSATEAKRLCLNRSADRIEQKIREIKNFCENNKSLPVANSHLRRFAIMQSDPQGELKNRLQSLDKLRELLSGVEDMEFTEVQIYRILLEIKNIESWIKDKNEQITALRMAGIDDGFAKRLAFTRKDPLVKFNQTKELRDRLLKELGFSPTDAFKFALDYKSIDLVELKASLRQIEDLGFNSTEARVIYNRYADPFAKATRVASVISKISELRDITARDKLFILLINNSKEKVRAGLRDLGFQDKQIEEILDLLRIEGKIKKDPSSII